MYVEIVLESVSENQLMRLIGMASARIKVVYKYYPLPAEYNISLESLILQFATLNTLVTSTDTYRGPTEVARGSAVYALE